MQPSYPSLTFPNHYTLATGLYPSHHGIVDNTFYDAPKNKTYRIGDRSVVTDGSWYGGTPIWVLAEQQQCSRPAILGGIRGGDPGRQADLLLYVQRFGRVGHPYPGGEELAPASRGDQAPSHYVLFVAGGSCGAHERPRFEKRRPAAVHIVDDCVGRMVQTLDSLHLPISYIFVSDHGMALEDTLHTLPPHPQSDTNKFIFTTREALLHLYAKDKRTCSRPTWR